MDGFRILDEAAFRWLNRVAVAPWLDPVARLLSGHPLFVPVLVVLALGLLWRGGPRGVVLVLVLGSAAGLANEFIAEPLKDWFQRPRPYAALPDAILRVGRGNPLGSMPSAHAMNMALIGTVFWWYYRSAGAWILGLAGAVGWSRIYNGVHFPGDVLAGFGIGAGFGLLWLWVCELGWSTWVIPTKWPVTERVPSLWDPPSGWRTRPRLPPKA